MSLQAFLAKVITFINEAVIPLILAVAFVIFLWNLARYFIIQEEKRDEAKRLAFWGILAFVVIVSIWGIVNLFVNGLDLNRDNALCPDYNPTCMQQDEPETPQCIGGIICHYHEDGSRSCFAC